MGDLSQIRRHNESVLRSLKRGDLVEFPRSEYSHWAVYIGNEDVVHRAGVGNSVANISASCFSSCGDMSNKAKVCKDNFWEVAKDSMARINNSKDEKWSALSAEEIVKNALAKIGEVGYNLLSSNCEHFANWCRYGISHSDQVANVVEDVTKAVVITAGVFGVAAVTVAAVNAVVEHNKSAKKKK